MFGPYGSVTEARIITDRATSLSKGYGFVTMATIEGAQVRCWLEVWQSVDIYIYSAIEGIHRHRLYSTKWLKNIGCIALLKVIFAIGIGKFLGPMPNLEMPIIAVRN